MEQQTCVNCKYYLQHYVKGNSVFRAIACGHCIHRDLARRAKRNVPFISDCEYWESIELQVAERRDKTVEILRDVCNHLEQIAQILEEDAVQRIK